VTSASGLPGGDFWAITSYFNPLRYKRRFSNYKTFRKNLNVPLIAIELAYSDAFELQEGDADILLQVRGGAVLWQKERLLNVALRALPPSCRKVAWVDCDIIFRNADWAESAHRLLDRVAMVQLFKQVHLLRPDQDPAGSDPTVEFSRPSGAYAVSSGVPAADCFGYQPQSRVGTAAPGFAWATHRDLLDRHGFYDACIVGGGDRAIICAAHGCISEIMMGHFMNDPQRQRYRAWAEPVCDELKADTAFIEGDILHLWHGDIGDRAPRARHEGLQKFGFDPCCDIAIQENGCWRWNTDKPDMHEYVRGYFAARREDG
jgi:hypothetical protein